MAQSSHVAPAPVTLDLVSVERTPKPPATNLDLSSETLFERLWSFGNLWRAYCQAARGKRTRPDVATFDYDMEGRLLQLRDRLRAQTYRPNGYRRFMFNDPKPRAISAAPFADRVVHHALVNVIEPLYERRFIADSYANRHGRGIHQALDRATQFARRYRYVLRCDIVQFFPSIDLAILRRNLGRVVRDDGVLCLCDQILAGGAHELIDQYTLVFFPGETPEAAQAHARGLPIGNQTSQFWANVYLHPLDQFVKSELRCPAYLRYVDDFLLFSDDKATLHRWKAQIIAFLATKLRLTIHERESAVAPVTVGVPFLGFRVYPWHRLLRRRNGVAFARRLCGLHAAYQAGKLSEAELTMRVQSWVAHVAHGDTWRLRASLLRVRLPAQSARLTRPTGRPSEKV
ncbi:MAG TPA: reverse transcriptase/maturase family protein [Ktedonobacterales bacterium]|nr:reverse transcriptase/maturase family protein [Ktedonobacterales bacterium]